MNTENKQALELLKGIALSNEMLITLSQDLRTMPEVVGVLHSLEARKHPSGAALEGYVDAELHNGKAICWWMDAYWKEEQWVIECSILVQTDEGQQVVKEFPEKTASTIEEFVNRLNEATRELTSSADIQSLLIYSS
jgi:hypothetical protein